MSKVPLHRARFISRRSRRLVCCFNQGKAIPRWQGNLLAGALKLQHLNRIVLDPQGRVVAEKRLLEGLSERIRALQVDPNGWLYLSTDSGRILRLRPAS